MNERRELLSGKVKRAIREAPGEIMFFTKSAAFGEPPREMLEQRQASQHLLSKLHDLLFGCSKFLLRQQVF